MEQQLQIISSIMQGQFQGCWKLEEMVIKYLEVRNDEIFKLGFLKLDLDLLSTDELLLQCKAELMIMELKAHCSA